MKTNDQQHYSFSRYRSSTVCIICKLISWKCYDSSPHLNSCILATIFVRLYPSAFYTFMANMQCFTKQLVASWTNILIVAC